MSRMDMQMRIRVPADAKAFIEQETKMKVDKLTIQKTLAAALAGAALPAGDGAQGKVILKIWR